MAPIDSSPVHTASFELVSSLKAYNKIPVREFKSRRTQLTVIIAEVEGPIVDGYLCLATEAHDDDGLPHILEHLIFLGSEDYPYKGILDLLANRCLASGTNAWTDVDHTCYTIKTAGADGFLSLLPIYLDHILYPILTDYAYLTEVHHITEKGENAGVVYCEIQGRENYAESKVHFELVQALYPGECGYKANFGGVLKNFRESTTNEKVRQYHKAFYRPENLKIIITGQVKPEKVFESLIALENKIISKGDLPPFERPWQKPVPPLEESKDIEVKYPCDDESNGIVAISWRGPSAVSELYMLNATSIILKYLTDLSVSPLQKEFVEIPDPYASRVAYNLFENSETAVYILFENVPLGKIKDVKPRVMELLQKIVDTEDLDMNRLKCVIHRHKLESLSYLENSPHKAIAFMVIGHMLYGQSQEDLQHRLNPIDDLEIMLNESKEFWLKLIKKYLIEGKVITVKGVPSIKEQQRLAEEEENRIKNQCATLKEEGLKKKGLDLQEAIDFNERPCPSSVLTSIPIPSTKSINYHEINRFVPDDSPLYTYLDQVNTNFVYMFTLMDTNDVPPELKLYIPLLLEAFLESPIMRGGTLVPYEDVIFELESDTVTSKSHIGLGGMDRFACGLYSQTVSIMLQVETTKYKRGVEWLREILYQTKFITKRIQIIAQKMVNDVSRIKRKGYKVTSDLMNSICYIKGSNQYNNSMLRQQKFLSNLLEQLKTSPEEVLENLEKTRKIITNPSNMALYLAANLKNLPQNPIETLKFLFPETITPVRKNLNVTPDYNLMKNEFGDNSCIVGLGCTDSSYLCHVTPSIRTHDHPDIPIILTYIQYVIQLEGPLWKQIRGKGFAYNYNIFLKINEGLLYLVFSKATNVVGAFKETRDIMTTLLKTKVWDKNLLESAKSSLIYKIVENEKTIGHVVDQSLLAYFKNVDLNYYKWLVQSISAVTEEDLNSIGQCYFTSLFTPSKCTTTIVCHPSKVEEICTEFQKMDLNLKVYSTLEKSFLSEL